LFPKTRFQDIGESELGITAERDPEKHRIARKALNPGFSPKVLKTREFIIHNHTDQFVSQLKKLGNTDQGLNIIDVLLSPRSSAHIMTNVLIVVQLVSLGYCWRYGVRQKVR
jgi:hypothetical protein